MANRIQLPMTPNGRPEEQLQQLYSYLYQMAVALNSNMAEIGGTSFTDEEMRVVQEVVADTGETTAAGGGAAEAESLKSLIIKTAKFVKTQIDQYNMRMIGTTTAEGKLGRYVRKTKLDVDITPTGIQQNYSFDEIIQGLRTYEINSKNYIRTGLLREVGAIPVYGVQIGKDIVTFSQDGTEEVVETNRVAELTDSELSFYQGEEKIASFTGSKITFYYNETEAFYIQNGKIYCVGDLEITSGSNLIIRSLGGMEIESGADFIVHSGNIDIDDAGLTIKRGILTGSHYDMDGNPLLSAGDVVVSSTQPAAKTGRIWLQPISIATAEYSRYRSSSENFSNGDISFTLAGSAVSAISGNNKSYTLSLPVWCGSTDAANVAITVTVSNGSSSVTFSGTIPKAYYSSGTYVGKWTLNLTLTSSTWLATTGSLNITVSLSGSQTAFQKQTHGVDAGNTILKMTSTGSSSSGWTDCNVKAYQ